MSLLDQINSANELILTELILENALAAYSAEEAVALLSCFVFQEKSEYEPVLPERLTEVGPGPYLSRPVLGQLKLTHDSPSSTGQESHSQHRRGDRSGPRSTQGPA